ncbi:GAF domain-containing sensor histidine kinase [Thermosulfuriphilus sp.]
MDGPKVRRLYPVRQRPSPAGSQGLKQVSCLIRATLGKDDPLVRLERLLRTIKGLLNLDQVALYLRDNVSRSLTPLVGIGIPSDPVEDSLDNAFGYVLFKGKPLFIEDSGGHDELLDPPLFQKAGAWAIVPWDDDFRAILALASRGPRSWSEEDKELVLDGLYLATGLIKEFELQRDLHHQQSLTKIVTRIDRIFHFAKSPQGLLEELVILLKDLFKIAGVAIRLESNSGLYQAQAGDLPLYCRKNCSKTLCGGSPSESFQTMVCLPLEIPSAQGALCLFAPPGEEEAFKEAVLSLQTVGRMISRGISTVVALEEMRRLAEENQTMVDQLAGLYEVGLYLLAANSPQDLGREFLARLTTHPGLSCPRAALVLKKDHRRYMAEVVEGGTSVFRGPVLPPSRDELPQEVVQKMGPSPLIYPLMAGPEPLGLLAVDSQSFVEDDRGFRLLASYLAVSLEKTLLYAGLERANRELLITKDRLVDSEKRAALGELASAIAHEIRNPLSILGGLARRASRASSAEEARRYLDRMVSQVARLEKVLRGLLDVNYRCPRCFGQEDLNRLVEEALFLLEREIQARGIRVEKDFHPLPRVDCDGHEIRYVISCLILNALQAMGEGGILSIRTYTDEEVEPTVVFEVSDTGGGIPLDILPNIFNPFFGTKRSRGLGLALAYRIVRFHEGEILVDNRPGKGATFIIKLPLWRRKQRFQTK